MFVRKGPMAGVGTFKGQGLGENDARNSKVITKASRSHLDAIC